MNTEQDISNFKTAVDDRLLRIANVLLLNASFLDNPGLLNGKMGIAIFFFNLAGKTHNQVYEYFAGELIEQVIKDIHTASPVNFSSGLSGIGWGVEYLVQNGFVEPIDDNILEELDYAVFRLDRKKPDLHRVYDDFYGYGLYYLCRAKSDIWNEEALHLIWNDLTALFLGDIPDNIKIEPDYIISILYFVYEIRKRLWCPPGIDEIIAAIPTFVSKYMDDINIIEHIYFDILFRNLGINYSTRTKTVTNQSTVEKEMELNGQAAIYTVVFPDIKFDDCSVNNGIVELPEHEEFLRKICGIFSNKELIIPRRMTGIMLALLKRDNISLNLQVPQPVFYRAIYIFTKKSRAGEYGIGTYIKELTTCLKNAAFNVTVINLETDRNEFTIEDNEGIRDWYIPACDSGFSSTVNNNEFLTSIIALFRLYIPNTGSLIFHFNFIRDYQLAVYLRKYFTCKILLIVHFMSWSSVLQGDLARMRKILSAPGEIKDPVEKKALSLFEEDRTMLKYADHIVCLGDYQRDILCLDYGIKTYKITVINNGLTDKSRSMTPEERSGLRTKYRIEPNEKIILFAGRLDEIKGVSFLIKAFREVLEHEPGCRLWIIGDGAYNPLLKDANSMWSKLCFTGKISQTQLHDLYNITDIGVVPSLFEPFGYVAVEMMIHGLPVVASATTGLNEIVDDGFSGFRVPMVNNSSNEIDTNMMAQRIIYLLQNPEERKKLGKNGRERYLEKYTTSLMYEKMTHCYFKLFQILSDYKNRCCSTGINY